MNIGAIDLCIYIPESMRNVHEKYIELHENRFMSVYVINTHSTYVYSIDSIPCCEALEVP